MDEKLRHEIYKTLDWMIKALEFSDKNTGMHGEDSPEMKEAKELRGKIMRCDEQGS